MDASHPQLSVIVPTRNESQNVQPLLDRLEQALAGLDYEVVFVDDSSDGTAAIIEGLQDAYPFPIQLLARPPEGRNGLSGAVVDGMYLARGEWLCVMDADLQHPPTTIMAMLTQAKKSGADVVVGSRRGDFFGPYGLSRMRSMNSKLLTIVARALFPRSLKNASDPLTGLFLVRRVAVDIEALRPDGFKILLEILVRNPNLQVSEVHFDFAPRHTGESKADVREGARFFRHLVLLRSTANAHMGRFVVMALGALAANMLLFAVLLRAIHMAPVWAVLFSAELTWLAVFFVSEFWVFSERDEAGRRRRFWGYFLLSQLAIFAVHLPLFVLLTSVLDVATLAANFASLVVVALVRYLFSEQSVWTGGSMVWQPQSYYYNLHDLVRLESQVPLRDLTYFATDKENLEIDIQIRVDRQGTPTPLSGGISYDDQLGRFGFGLTVLPADYTQVVVSPLLAHSPDFLYTNVIEPILRWRLVSLGYALVKAACVAKEGRAFLISADQDFGPLISVLSREESFSFLADDLTLLDRQGFAFCYPKPVTVNRVMLANSQVPRGMVERLSLAGQRLLYTRLVRRAGLWLSGQDVPAATLNSYLQRFVPQPKHELTSLYPGTEVEDCAKVSLLICECDFDSPAIDFPTATDCLQQSETIAAFQPHPVLAKQLREWGGGDLFRAECEIIETAMEQVPMRLVDPSSGPAALLQEVKRAPTKSEAKDVIAMNGESPA
ncbi:MAG: glycosyltransferase [Candidatus Promineifilaceae bacterium]